MQVGAAIMLAAGRVGGMAHARGLILAGSAAGIAAAFNTPLAGIVFAIEEMGRAYEARTNGLVLSAVVLAGLASLALTGNYTYFGRERRRGRIGERLAPTVRAASSAARSAHSSAPQRWAPCAASAAGPGGAPDASSASPPAAASPSR